MPYIKTISDDEAEGIVKKNYESSRKANGANYSTERILSLWPKVQTMENRRYQAVMLDTSELTRATKEMIGAAVSAANNCDYCVQHHVSMMVEAGVDPSTAWQVADDYTQARVDERTQALLEFALTARPDLTNQTDVDKLKALGISDREILEAVVVAGFFRDYNLRVSILGLELEDWFHGVPRGK